MCICLCIFIYIYIHIYTYVCMYIYTHIYVNIFIWTYIYVYTYIFVYIYVFLPAPSATRAHFLSLSTRMIYTQVYIYTYICIHIRMYLHTHKYIHIHKHIDIRSYKWIHTHNHPHKHSLTHTHTLSLYAHPTQPPQILTQTIAINLTVLNQQLLTIPHRHSHTPLTIPHRNSHNPHRYSQKPIANNHPVINQQLLTISQSLKTLAEYTEMENQRQTHAIARHTSYTPFRPDPLRLILGTIAHICERHGHVMYVCVCVCVREGDFLLLGLVSEIPERTSSVRIRPWAIFTANSFLFVYILIFLFDIFLWKARCTSGRGQMVDRTFIFELRWVLW